MTIVTTQKCSITLGWTTLGRRRLRTSEVLLCYLNYSNIWHKLLFIEWVIHSATVLSVLGSQGKSAQQAPKPLPWCTLLTDSFTCA